MTERQDFMLLMFNSFTASETIFHIILCSITKKYNEVKSTFSFYDQRVY